MNSSFTKKYKVLEKIGEGSFSDVLKCQNRETESMYAAKRLKKTYRRIQLITVVFNKWISEKSIYGQEWSVFVIKNKLCLIVFSMQEVYDCPEIIAMRKVSNHPNILHIIETHYDQFPGKVTLIFELMDMSVYDFMKTRKRCLLENKVKNFTFQLLKGLEHLHKSGIFHRDLKPENILIKSQSSEDTRNFFCSKRRFVPCLELYQALITNEIIKIGDLGSIRGIYSKPPYTEYISTRWYRSPECLLTNGYYGPKMDVWAVGCVFYELLTLKPLFPGTNELDQINKIHKILGTPSSRVLNKFKKHKSRNCEYFFPSYDGSGFTVLLPTVSDPGRDIIKQMLTYDPDHRANVRRLLEHRYFLDYRDLDDHAKRRRSQSETPPIIKSHFTGDWRVPLYYNFLSPEAKQTNFKNQGTFMDVNSERELKITNLQNSGKTKFKSKSGSLNVLKPDSNKKNSIATQVKTLPELIKIKSVGKSSHKSLHASVAKVELKPTVQSRLNTLKSYAKNNANKLLLQSVNDSNGPQLKTSGYVLNYKTKKVSDPNTVDKTLPSSGENKYLSKSFVLPRRSSGKSTLEPIHEVTEQVNSLRASAAKQRSVSRQEQLTSLKLRPPARKNTRTKLLPPLNKSLIQKKLVG